MSCIWTVTLPLNLRATVLSGKMSLTLSTMSPMSCMMTLSRYLYQTGRGSDNSRCVIRRMNGQVFCVYRDVSRQALRGLPSTASQITPRTGLEGSYHFSVDLPGLGSRRRGQPFFAIAYSSSILFSCNLERRRCLFRKLLSEMYSFVPGSRRPVIQSFTSPRETPSLSAILA
jgi:hypothetical protein